MRMLKLTAWTPGEENARAACLSMLNSTFSGS